MVLAGRMMLKREAGKKAAFATLQDSSGPRADGRIQIYVTLDLTGEAAMAALHHYDLGDILGVDRHAVQDQDRRTDRQGQRNCA